MLMIFGPGGREHDSPNQLFNFGDTKILKIMQETIPNHFKTYYFGKSQNLGHRELKQMERSGADILKIQKHLGNLECWINPQNMK